ncbi:partial argininosuccinate lyase, partial [Anaerolineae bacterium]
PYDLDRRYAARLLGFSRVTENSLDSVSDRDFIMEFLSAASIMMVHFSRLSEELILWSSQEFGFIELSDAFSTGSSIMPQKKNPDIAELARGKTGRVFGSLVSILTAMKALPLAYNKDMQEDKVPLFDTVDTVKAVLKVYGPMLLTMKVNRDRMLKATGAGFLNATDAADYLVRRGVPFRQAHEVAGRTVAYCIEKGKTLEELTLVEWKALSPAFEKDIKEAVSIKRSLNVRKVYGGTALATVRKRLKAVKKEISGGCC